jgi:DNA-binding Lrp family transcriptional regulator
LAAAGSLAGRILGLLRSKGQQTTSELVEGLGVARSSVLRECRQLAEEGEIERHDPHRFYFPVTAEMMTRANADRIRELAKKLRAVIGDRDRPIDGQLRSDLQRYFEELRGRNDLLDRHDRIDAFETKLLAIVEAAIEGSAETPPTRRELLRQIGPMPLDEVEWSLPSSKAAEDGEER